MGAVLKRGDDGDATARELAPFPVVLRGALHERAREGKGGTGNGARPPPPASAPENWSCGGRRPYEASAPIAANPARAHSMSWV